MSLQWDHHFLRKPEGHSYRGCCPIHLLKNQRKCLRIVLTTLFERVYFEFAWYTFRQHFGTLLLCPLHCVDGKGGKVLVTASNKGVPFRVALSTYLVLLIAYQVAAYIPEHRIWGLNVWAYGPDYAPLVYSLVGLLILPGLLYFSRIAHRPSDELLSEAKGRPIFLLIALGIVALFTVAFWYLRAQTHFLGDGYTVLSLLAADEPLIKTREVGEALIHIWTKSLLGVKGEAGALWSFQVISIGSGIAFLASVILTARSLFARTPQRVLFILGMASGGYMLLFFGYVEYYSVFVLSVALCSMAGLLVARGQLSRWILLPILALAVSLHVFGVTLIPATIYLLISGTSLGNRIARVNPRTKLLTATLLVVAGVVIFLYYFYTNLYFRFAVLPLLHDRFTVDGYTMFSAAHLIDFGNLLLLLVPSLLLVAVTLVFLPVGRLFRKRVYCYLLLLVLSVWGAVFVFDPKLGMPRDWDLFSFAGVPLALFCTYLILDNREIIRRYMALSLLCSTLGLLVLVPRAISQTVPEISIAFFENYADLDVARNMGGRSILSKYYEEIGDKESSDRLLRDYLKDYPEFGLNRQALDLRREGKSSEAIPLYRRAIELHPGFSAAYANLGLSYLGIQQLDSALTYLEIAAAMNPYFHLAWKHLAKVYFARGDFKQAERALRKALKYSQDKRNPLAGLVRVYKETNQQDKLLECLIKLSDIENSPVAFLKQLGDHYLERGEFQKAGRIYQRALIRGLDSSYIEDLSKRFPQLGF